MKDISSYANINLFSSFVVDQNTHDTVSYRYKCEEVDYIWGSITAMLIAMPAVALLITNLLEPLVGKFVKYKKNIFVGEPLKLYLVRDCNKICLK